MPVSLFDEILQLKKDRKHALEDARSYRIKAETRSQDGKLSAEEARTLDAKLKTVEGLTQKIESREREERALSESIAQEAHRKFGGSSESNTRIFDPTGKTQVRTWAKSEAPKDLPRDLRIGRVIRAFVTGEWKEAEAERSFLGTTSPTKAGMLIPQELMGEVYTALTNRPGVFDAGAKLVTLEHGNMKVAVGDDPPVPKFYTEGQRIDVDNNMTFRSVDLSFKKAACIVEMSGEFIRSAGNSAVDAIEKTIRDQLNQIVDYALLAGGGLNGEPLGIVGTTGVGSHDYEDSALTWDDLIGDVYALAANNVEPARIRFLHNAKLASKLATEREGSSGGYLMGPPAIATNLDRSMTEQIPVTEGTPDTTYGVLGDFTNAIVGIHSSGVFLDWGHTETGFEEDKISMRMIFPVDVGLVFPSHFRVLENIAV